MLQKKGLSPFAVHQLPHAVITLKRGAGRLIRSETDRGVLVICDTRTVEKPYGRQIWQSLPPFARTRESRRCCASCRTCAASLWRRATMAAMAARVTATRCDATAAVPGASPVRPREI